MDEGVRIALKRMKELKLEYQKLERFVVMHEELTGNKIPRDELLADVNNGPNSESVGKEPKRRNNVKKLLDIMERVIREANRPLSRGEIAFGMERLNVTVYASDVPKYLGTLLWRNDSRFVSVGDGYVTKKMSLEAATQQAFRKMEDKKNQSHNDLAEIQDNQFRDRE